ncbi:MAG: sigma-70 family RNA polymerase sigma factor [Deltaproteobacteria bacterium]|nr:sigma-70 family RNA polymerase sigma factor [Deltaproteobacteria bacterium]
MNTAMNLPVPANSLEIYLAQIGGFPLLRKDEEKSLAVRYHQDGDVEAAHQLVTANLRFVVKIALEYRNYGIKLADLIQEGNIGLMVAVKKFNPYKGFRLITYAVWWIRSHIQAYILKGWSLVKRGGRELRKKLFYQLNKSKEAIASLSGDGGDKGSLEYSRSSVLADGQDLSLNEVIGSDSSTTHLDLLTDASPNQEEVFAEDEERSLARRSVSTALATLNERERYVVEKRVMDEAPESLQAIGDELGLTRERVRQIEGEALKKLRKRIER